MTAMLVSAGHRKKHSFLMQQHGWTTKLRKAESLSSCFSGVIMQKTQKNPGFNTMFYSPCANVKEIHSGYLVKSPPHNQFKKWKKRYFVLFKVSEHNYQLEYFKSKEKRDKYGTIELSSVSLLVQRPEEDQRWPWIQKNFNCPPSNVIYIETNERGYFLIGEDSQEMDKWFSKLFNAMKKRPHRVMSSEDICSGKSTLEISPKDLALKKSSNTKAEKQNLKMRSSSDPSSNAVDHDKKAKDVSYYSLNGRQGEDPCKRRASGPEPEIYDHPLSFLKRAQVLNDTTTRRKSMDSVYESMMEIRSNGLVAQAEDREVKQATDGIWMQSVSEAFHRLKCRLSLHEEAASGDSDETRRASDLSSSSSENIATSPVDVPDTPNVRTLDKQSSTESVDNIIPEERDIEVKRADLKKHLSITEVDGRPCVSGWTGQPQSVCLFHRGDQILAINDLHAGSVDEFNMYLSRSLKNEVKVTILRLHGCLPLHTPNCLCGD